MWPKYKCLLPYSFIVLIRVINVRIYCWWYDYRNVLLSPNAAMVFWDPVVVGRPRCWVYPVKLASGHINALGRPPGSWGHRVPGRDVGYMPQVGGMVTGHVCCASTSLCLQ